MEKKIISVILMLAVTALLGACNSAASQQTENPEPQAETIYESISSSVSLLEAAQMDSDYLMNYYGIDTAELNSYACYNAVDATKAETIMIIEVKSKDTIAAIQSEIELIRDEKLAEMENYIPEQYQVVKNSQVQTRGNFVWLVISENQTEIEKIIDENI